jgi:hypothetical protein
MALRVEAINRATCLAVMNDGQILQITHWLADEGECAPWDATSCVCGPCKNGCWYTVYLSEFNGVMQ